MGKFKKKRGSGNPKISTSSLPDIIFMLLFFFMVVVQLRDSELKVGVTTPYATELTKLEEKSLVNYIYVGRPTQQYREAQGTAPRIQLGDKFSRVEDITLFLEKHRTKVGEGKKSKITTSLRVDKDVTMGIVSDIKTQLRKSQQLKVNYSAKNRTGSGVGYSVQ